jgi:hypothetical protein
MSNIYEVGFTALNEGMPVRPRYRFRADRGGHAPGHISDALTTCIDEWFCLGGNWYDALGKPETIEFANPTMQRRWDRMKIRDRARWLVGQLWNCTDIIGGSYSSGLDLPGKQTIAAGVRYLATLID